MDRLCDRIWLGSADDVRDPARLQAAGISAVVNITPETDNLPPDAFRVLRMNQPDGEPVPRERIVGFLDFMLSVLAERRSVLIHCQAGVSRTGGLAIAWLMSCGFSWDEAERMVKVARPVQPHPAIRDSVLAFFAR